MPIEPEYLAEHGVIHTRLIGRVTDAELLAYYELPLFRELKGTWLEIVDGTAISFMAITPDGQRKLARMTMQPEAMERLRGGRVAMVAGGLVTYGMFRMWEMQREGAGFDVHVFRRFDDAFAWVTGPPVP